MNALQSGTPASSLAPQGFKNSTQSGIVQGTLNHSNVQQATDDLLQAPIQGKLQVVTGGQQNVVLGATTTIASEPQNTTETASNAQITIALFALFISVVAFMYFYRRYRALALH